MNVTKFPRLLALCFVLTFALTAAALAQDVTDDDVNRVASQLFCPTCEAVPVDVCPTQVCQDWRTEIRNQLSDGRSDEEILTYFATRYGEGVLANVPTSSGIGLIIWIVPIVIVTFTLLIFGLIFWLLRWRRQSAPPQSLNPAKSQTVTIEEGILAQLEQEIEDS